MEENSRHDTESSTPRPTIRNTFRKHLVKVPIILDPQDRSSFPIRLFNQLQRLILASLADFVVQPKLDKQLNDKGTNNDSIEGIKNWC